MRIISTVVLSLFILFFVQRGVAQENRLTLSFEEALKISMENNPRFRQDNFLKQEMKEKKKAAFGLFMPSVGVGANYLYMSDDLHLDLNPVGKSIGTLYETLGKYGIFKDVPMINPQTGAPIMLNQDQATPIVRGQLLQGAEKIKNTNWDQMIQKKQFATLNANLALPLYAGGKIRAANKAARLMCEEADLKAQQSYSDHIKEMVERYYGLSLSYQVEKVRKKVFNAMQNHLNDAEKMYSEGMIAKVQYLHAKVYFDEAQRELMKSGRQVEIVNEALKNSLGLNEDKQIVPLSSLFYTHDLKTLDFYVDKAIEQSVILKQVDTKKQLAEENFKVKRADMLPQVAAMGTYNIANKDLSPYLPEYMVGVGLKWNIFSGRKSWSQTKAARYTVQRVQEIGNKYKADIITGVTKYYQNLQMCLEQLEELNTSMEFAKEYLKVREKSFKEGMATSTELVDAQLAVTKVEIERLKVLFDFDVNLSKLYDLCGMAEEYISIDKKTFD